jgi:ABC-type multidrug transport system fused ATPase/permease subunit
MVLEIGFFDNEKNSTGALTARLADEASQVQGLVGRNFSTIVQVSATMIGGLTIAFYYGWLLTIIVLVVMPLVGIAGAMQMAAMTGFGSKTKEAYDSMFSLRIFFLFLILI